MTNITEGEQVQLYVKD